VEQTLDHPQSETPPDTGRWRALRTVALLLGGLFASLLMVELPVPVSGAESDDSRRQVPASEKWIPLGVAQPSETVVPAVAAGPRRARRHPHASAKAKPTHTSKSARHHGRSDASGRRATLRSAGRQEARPHAASVAARPQRLARGV